MPMVSKAGRVHRMSWGETQVQMRTQFGKTSARIFGRGNKNLKSTRLFSTSLNLTGHFQSDITMHPPLKTIRSIWHSGHFGATNAESITSIWCQEKVYREDTRKSEELCYALPSHKERQRSICLHSFSFSYF